MTDTRSRLLAVTVILGGLAALTACGSSSSGTTASTAATTGGTTPTTATSAAAVPSVPAGTCVHTPPSTPNAAKQYSAAPPMTISTAKTYTATMLTSCGTIVIHLSPAQAPKTVNNFVFLADQGFYNGLTFHRVIPQFVIQGGDPQGNGTGGPGYQFADELPSSGYQIGDLAMANSGANTNGSQFFIVEGAEGAALPLQYSRFGHVTSGLDTVRRIANVPQSGAPNNTPNQSVWIYKVTIAVS